LRLVDRSDWQLCVCVCVCVCVGQPSSQHETVTTTTTKELSSAAADGVGGAGGGSAGPAESSSQVTVVKTIIKTVTSTPSSPPAVRSTTFYSSSHVSNCDCMMALSQLTSLHLHGDWSQPRGTGSLWRCESSSQFAWLRPVTAHFDVVG